MAMSLVLRAVGALTPALRRLPAARRGVVVASFSGGGWGKLGLVPAVVDALESELELSSPSEIQAKAIPAILAGEDIMFAAETGSGKTLGYLAPVFSMLKAEEELGGVDRVEKRPRALVLVPTRELGTQVLGVAKRLAKSEAKLTCRGIVGGSEGVGRQRRQLKSSSVDVVVASPGRFLKLWRDGDVYTSRVAHVVVDEADTMLSQGWGPDLRQILKATMLFREGRRAQLVLTSATLTPAVREAFAGEPRASRDEAARRDLWSFVPPVRIVRSDALHRAVRELRARSVSAVGKDKFRLLVEELQAHTRSRQAKKTMVFCNTVASCRAAEYSVREEFDDQVRCYHGDMNSAEREASLAAFRDSEGPAILVCTDLAARGLDLPEVDHVLNCDFPRNPIDFLHRAGRTARFGQRGMVTSLVTKHDKVLAAAIDRAIANDLPLDGLTGARKDYAPGGKLAADPGATVRGSAKLELANAATKGNRHRRAPSGSGRGKKSTQRATSSASSGPSTKRKKPRR